MKRHIFHLLLTLLLAVVQSIPLHSQQEATGYEPNSRILFIFDASYSMAGSWEGETKIGVARRILE